MLLTISMLLHLVASGPVPVDGGRLPDPVENAHSFSVCSETSHTLPKQVW